MPVFRQCTIELWNSHLGKRVWFAESLLSSATEEVRRVIVLARQWAERLGKPVRGWMSDQQEAFVNAIAAEFPGTPHRYCTNHFLRDLAKPVLAMDSHAKVKMRSKVRGLRAIEWSVLEEGRKTAGSPLTVQYETPKADDTLLADAPEADSRPADDPLMLSALSGLCLVSTASALDVACSTAAWKKAGEGGVGEVVLESCAAVRGILNDDQGGPLSPPGIRMSEALDDVRTSLAHKRLGHQSAYAFYRSVSACMTFCFWQEKR